MSPDKSGRPDDAFEHLQVVKETIDRNLEKSWERYEKEYEFVVIDDGAIKVAKDPDSEGESALTQGEVYVVETQNGTPTDCTCYIARRPFDPRSCRHMRAVDAHPLL